MGVSLSALIFYYDVHIESERLRAICKQRFSYGVLLLLMGVLDGLCQALGFYDSGNLARFISGFIGGAGVFLLLYPGKMNTAIYLPREG